MSVSISKIDMAKLSLRSKRFRGVWEPKERNFWCFARAGNGERAKNEIWG